VKERDALVEQVKGLNEKVAGLKENMKTAEVTLISQEEQELDPVGRYAVSDRADLIKKILAVEEAMVAAA
ncbi:hypothetical protein A2U01_0114905, partial [Trifolium medium]|nr:hypothetical protein [Trifolium medium]